MTSWVVSAFGINSHGIAKAATSFELRGFETFFLSMNIPYSVKRGEVFALRVTIFNYRDTPSEVKPEATVRLSPQPGQFVETSGQLGGNGWYEQKVELSPNLASSVIFMVKVTTVGEIDLVVEAEEGDEFDSVKRKLLAKPEGVERSDAITKVLITEKDDVTETFKINWPQEGMVPESQRVAVKITGDVFGQALSNLDDLVTAPYGCGEQNMISTVPNVFGVAYIRATLQKDMETAEENMLTNMKKGYLRQVDKYRHRDGSFSAWGEYPNGVHANMRGKPGSTWLTAFVIKSFSKASKFIDVDPLVLQRGLDFLKNKQMTNGQFREDGNVIHKEITSGTTSMWGLTVYVVICMLETSQALQMDYSELTKIIRLDDALKYMEQGIPTDQRSSGGFLIALSAYAVSLLPQEQYSEVKQRLFNRLTSLIAEIGFPWSVNSEVEYQQQGARSPNRRASTTLLQTASYLLLARINMMIGDTSSNSEALAIMRWLESKQNSKGGFSSTQDTVMVLQALSSYGLKFQEFAKGSVTVTDLSRTPYIPHIVDVSYGRSMLLQTVELASNTSNVEVRVSGPAKVVAVIKVVYYYFTQPGKPPAPTHETDDMTNYPGNPESSYAAAATAASTPTSVLSTPSPFTVRTSTKQLSDTVQSVEACVKSYDSLTDQGMVVTTLTLPSGERVIEEQGSLMKNNPNANRIETDGDEIHFYSDEPPGSGYCFQAQVERQVEFELQKPGSAKIYSYYTPEMNAETALEMIGRFPRNSGTPVCPGSVIVSVCVCVCTALLASV